MIFLRMTETHQVQQHQLDHRLAASPGQYPQHARQLILFLVYIRRSTDGRHQRLLHPWWRIQHRLLENDNRGSKWGKEGVIKISEDDTRVLMFIHMRIYGADPKPFFDTQPSANSPIPLSLRPRIQKGKTTVSSVFRREFQICQIILFQVKLCRTYELIFCNIRKDDATEV